MSQFRVDGLSLSYVNVRDHDRFVTILSPKIGLADLYVRGARSTKSRVSGCTDPFISGTWYGYQRQERYYLDAVDVRYRFKAPAADPICLAAAMHITEVIRDSASDPTMAEIMYPMAHHALYALEKTPDDWQRIVIATNLFMLYHLGFAPDTQHCGLCGAELSEGSVRYAHREGQFVCSKHPMILDPWTGQPAYHTYPFALRQVLRYLATSTPERFVYFKIHRPMIRALWTFMKEELAHRLERAFPKLAYLESLTQREDELTDLAAKLRGRRADAPSTTASDPSHLPTSVVPNNPEASADNPEDATSHHTK